MVKQKFWYCNNCGFERDNDKTKPCKQCEHWGINEGARDPDDFAIKQPLFNRPDDFKD